MAKRKKGLPFVVQPRLEPIVEKIGTKESGVIEIERKGYLTVAEKSITQGGLSGDNSVRKMYTLAGQIARKSGHQQAQVAQDLIKPERPEYMDPWADEISECLIEMVSFQERAAIIQATALIMCRIDASWTVDQTMELHPDLVTELAVLYGEEEQKTTDALEAAADASTGGAAGKS